MFFLPKRHASTEPKTVLVVSSTALGDTLWSSSVLSPIKNTQKVQRLYVLTSPVGAEVLKNHPAIDGYFILSSSFWKNWFSLRKTLRSLSIDWIFILHSSQRIIPVLCYSLKASRIYGYKEDAKGLDRLFSHSLKKKNTHEITLRADLLHDLCKITEPQPMLFDQQKRLLWKAPVGETPERKKTVVLHPGTKDLFRAWPIDLYQELAEKLNKHFSVIISAGAKEKHILASFKGSYQKHLSTDLSHLIDLCLNAHLLITNDTGPMHVAEALHMPCISIISPTYPEKSGPVANTKALVIYQKRTCYPCKKRKCLHPFCLRQISAYDVYNQAMESLS